MTAPRPTPQQLAWQRAEFGLFCHFGINTFHGKEWSDGTLSPAGFNPSRLDARQWVETARLAGARYLILTAKHHDGFCLWQTATTDYGVRSSPWRNGRGDVVAELAEACRDAGLPLGLYLSPWDRHEPRYPDAAAYDRFYTRQLEELCTRYGPLFEVWFDGAGSAGRVYDWDAIMEVVDRHQPGAVVFNMGRPTIRWVGNEDGLAADPCYYAVDAAGEPVAPGAAGPGAAYRPPECDVPIRQHWFWQGDDAHTLKSREHLLAIYYRSVGYGANLLLNVPPNRGGLIDEADRARLLEMADALRQRFAQPVEASLEHAGAGARAAFGRPVELDHLVLEEAIEDGQQADGYAVIDETDGRTIARGGTIGHKKAHAFPAVTTRALRIELAAPARLARATAFRTGHHAPPELGAVFDRDLFDSKVDHP
jgi:alpha-L-fucosidase